MKFDPPQGSVFGGYGFWNYSSSVVQHTSGGNGSATTPSAPARPTLRQRLFAYVARLARR